MGSFWYLKVYYIVTILGVLILRFFKQHISWFIALCVALTLIFNIDPNNYPSGQVGYVVYYLGIFLIGFQLKGKTIKSLHSCFICISSDKYYYNRLHLHQIFIIKSTNINSRHRYLISYGLCYH